jgi:hypothetical protein
MKDEIVAACLLFIFSSLAQAGVPNYGYSRDVDIGTLGSTPYSTTATVENNLLLHSYTFDLASASKVDFTLFNLEPELGSAIPPVPIIATFYDINIFDSSDHKLYEGVVTDKWLYGSTQVATVSGELPAGENYYLRIAGGIMNSPSPQLSYTLNMVATPVPEPGSYALLLSGLCMLGWRIRQGQLS